MAATIFSLPPEIRRQIYSYVFADAHSLFEFVEDTPQKTVLPTQRGSYTIVSRGNLGFLLASKQCYRDSVGSYHEARTVRIRNLGDEGLGNFSTLSHVYDTARTVELDGFHINDLSRFPSFPMLKSLVLNGVKMWGGYMIVERGQTALEAFDEGSVLQNLFNHVRYSSLGIQERISKYFPTADIVINFRIGHQVMDKNIKPGVQDWDWACTYNVKANKLDKRLANRLRLW